MKVPLELSASLMWVYKTKIGIPSENDIQDIYRTYMHLPTLLPDLCMLSTHGLQGNLWNRNPKS